MPGSLTSLAWSALLLLACGHARDKGPAHATEGPAPEPAPATAPAAPARVSVESGSPEPGGGDRPPPSLGQPSPAVRQATTPPDRGPDAVAPPDRAPENPLGYDTPVVGCFAGQVYLLPVNTRSLPRDYARLERGPVLHACEWNVPPQPFDKALRGTTSRVEWFAVRYEGAFHLARAGTYGFRVSSDDGSRLRVDGELVVDNDGLHAPKSERGQKELAAGDHSLVLEYFQGPRYHISLQVWITPPNGPEGLLSVRN